MTAPPATPTRLEDDGRCCRASSPVRPVASDCSGTVSLLSRSHELFQPALDARDLFARAEASPPLGPFLRPLVMFTRAGVLLSSACLRLVVERSLLQDRLLTLVVLLLAASPGDIDRIHHQPMADTGSCRGRDPPDDTLRGGGVSEPRIEVSRQCCQLFDR